MKMKPKTTGNSNALDLPVGELTNLLQRIETAGQIDINHEIVYLLEKLSRRFITDEYQEKSVQHFRFAVEQFRKFAGSQLDTMGELNLSLSAGRTYALMGEVQEATACYERAVELGEKAKDGHSLAEALRLLGNLRLQQGAIDAALRHFQKSLKISKNNGELLDQAFALNSLAAAYFQKAAWGKMEKTCNNALEIAEHLGHDELTACVYNNLGSMYSLRGRLEQALGALQKCIPLFEKIGDYRGLAEAYNNMGTVYRDKDLWGDAGKCYAKSLRYAETMGDVFVKASTSLNRIELYIRMYDLEVAKKQCLNVLGQFHRLGHKAGEIDACRMLGIIYTKEENWSLARKYLDEAITFAESSENTLMQAEAYSALADFYFMQGNKQQAAAHLQTAREHYRAMHALKKQKKIEARLKQLQAGENP